MSLAAETTPQGRLVMFPRQCWGWGWEGRRRAEPQPTDPGRLTGLSRPGEPSVIASTFSDLFTAIAGLVGRYFVDLSCSHGVQRGGDTCLCSTACVNLFVCVLECIYVHV